ncbi:MAG: ATP-dependent endonuclease [Pseudomonadota bacterium]
MYLAELSIKNFRRLNDVRLNFVPGLNVLVGPNNVGKTAVVDALRALLAGTDDPYPRFDTDDIHLPKGGTATGDIKFEYLFRDLSAEDEADFLHALRPGKEGKIEAVLGVVYGEPDKSGRLRSRKWCGHHDDILVNMGMLENLRSVYLPPLRDAAQGLKPSRTSQLSRLLNLLSDETGRTAIETSLKTLDDELKKHQPIVDTQNAIVTRHKAMLGGQFAQALNIGLSASDFQKLASRISLLVDAFEIESNGLGYNNLIYMAVVLSELVKNADAAFRGLIVEEPEAHLHPQLQSVLLRYLSELDLVANEKPVQVFVTSHSPNFASIAKLTTLSCLVDAGTKIESFHPREVKFEKGKREKLERYLDVTRAELFFARRVIFVEGAAELLMINLLAKRSGTDLRDNGISLISVEGLNFDSFMPLFGKSAIKIPVAILTDADPAAAEVEGEDPVAVYPKADEAVEPSDNAVSMKKREDEFVKIFYGVKTFEYDFALHKENRLVMLDTLEELHPRIGKALRIEVEGAAGDAAAAKVLFKGLFERKENNVQKGRFAQALAARIEDDNVAVVIPPYILSAIGHASQK